MHQIKIVNVVASTLIKGEIDLKKMHRLMSNTVYDPERFSGLTYRRTNPKVTLVMFSNGKILKMLTKHMF